MAPMFGGQNIARLILKRTQNTHTKGAHEIQHEAVDSILSNIPRRITDRFI